MKNIRIILFGLVALGQLAFAAQLILGREAVLREGKVYKFKTAPIDPSDPFRGKYVRLDFEESRYTDHSDEPWKRHQMIFVHLTVDSFGFAQIAGVSAERPEAGIEYVEARLVSVGEYEEPKRDLTLQYPFDRYYLEESKAPEAERRYRESATDEELEAYAKVRIKDGEAVLEEVIVDGIPLREWAREGGK
jgi:uncharacterized membrane-anchored protein